MHDAYLNFYEHDNFHFAYLAAHILLMYQIYLRLWQLSRIEPSRVIDVLTLAHFDEKDAPSGAKSLKEIVKNADSPMSFKIFKIEERVFVKILTLLEAEDYRPFKKAVDFRNALAHASGNLAFRDVETFEEKIEELKSLFETIHASSTVFLSNYIHTEVKKRQFSLPYIKEEVELDLDQLYVSQLMLSPQDCRKISSIYPSKNKLDVICREYFGGRAEEAGA